MYEFIYQNKKEYKKLEKGLRNLNELAYKTLKEAYSDLKNGDISDAYFYDLKKDIYEIELPTDKKFKTIHGSIKLIFEIIGNNIVLLNLLPQNILLASFNNKLITYKGVVLPADLPADKEGKYMFTIDLINMLQDK